MKSRFIYPFVWLTVFTGLAFTLTTSWGGWFSTLSFVDAAVTPEPPDHKQQTALAIPAATPVPGCVTPPAGMVSWWPFDGNGLDFYANHNAGLGGNPTFVPGEVAQALNFDGVDDITLVTGGPASSLNVGAGDGFTIELWINPSDLSVLRPLVEWNNSAGLLGVHLWQSVGAQGNLFANVVDTSGGSHIISSPPNTLIPNSYQHVALVYDKFFSIAILYVNGDIVAVESFPLFTPQTSYDLWFGYRATGPGAGTLFVGQMDEIEIFNRVLSQSEIQAIVSAAGAGKCKVRYVTNTNNSSDGSLRQAIDRSNSYPGSDTIYFNIQPSGGVKTISPTSGLPLITGPVTIDGTTQPGYAGAPLIELNGAMAGGAYGLVCQAHVTIKGLVINRFFEAGIYLDSLSSGSLITGNYIGTNATGNAPLGNRFGIALDGNISISNTTIGGTTAAARNIISGNNIDGIYTAQAHTNLIQGNFIGTDVTGTLDLGNGQHGINLDNAIFSNDDNTIGGVVSGARNIISGNGGDGIHVSPSSTGNFVWGNFIGTNVTGTQAIGNSAQGIFVGSTGNQIGGTTGAARNVISGNFQQGVEISGSSATQNTIQGNYIGTNAAGTGALGNFLEGVFVRNSASNNTIGGTAVDAGNVIANNRLDGVGVESSCVRNSIQGNSIFANSSAFPSLGIDLLPPIGVTPNDFQDQDTGANNLQNFAMLTSAISSGGSTTIQGTLHSTPGQSFRIEFFANSACDPSGNGEGQTFLGFTNVNTDGSGNSTPPINVMLPVSVPVGQFITSTATDVIGNTSEFSQCILVTVPTPTNTSTPTPTPTCAPTTLTEGFDDIATLPGAGWVQTNNSVPVGSIGWFQGNSTVLVFPAQSGATNSYIGANFNNTTGANTISNWLLTPVVTLQNGATMTFYTRTVAASQFPDRLQVRLSTNGASTNVGAGPTGLGDFTTLMLDINPFYQTGGVYPEVWTQFTVTVTGVPAATTGRLAFRYFVEEGGPVGQNSNYIGIDTFQFNGAVCPTPSPTPTIAPVISGTVTYGNAIPAATRFVSNVVINGAGSPTVMTTTGGIGPTEGQYSLTGFGAGSYTVTPTKTGGVNGAISSFDAGRIALHVAGPPNPQLSGNQLIVADVSGNSSVTSFDAGMIAKFVAGPPYSPPGIGATGIWRFTPVSRNYASVTSNITGEDYTALLMGEVSGNWMNSEPPRQPQNLSPPRQRKPLPPLLNQGGEPFAALPQMAASTDKEIIIPVSVQGAADNGIISYEFDLRYDPAVIQPQVEPVDVAGTVSRGLSVVTNATEPGLLRVVVYGALPIDENGVLLNLRFTAVGAVGSVSPLTWERIMFNEGEPTVTGTDGRVELLPASAD